MKRPILTLIFGAVFLLTVWGCTSNHVPAVHLNILDPSLVEAKTPWTIEIARRFPDADAIMVHGGDFVEGQWIMATDPTYQHVVPVESVIAKYKRPGHVLILVSCNTGHVVLHGHPGVFYAMDSVWIWPDRSLTPDTFRGAEAYQKLDGDDYPFDGPKVPEKSRWELDPGVVGNIFEFIEAR